MSSSPKPRSMGKGPSNPPLNRIELVLRAPMTTGWGLHVFGANPPEIGVILTSGAKIWSMPSICWGGIRTMGYRCCLNASVDPETHSIRGIKKQENRPQNKSVDWQQGKWNISDEEVITAWVKYSGFKAKDDGGIKLHQRWFPSPKPYPDPGMLCTGISYLCDPQERFKKVKVNWGSFQSK